MSDVLYVSLLISVLGLTALSIRSVFKNRKLWPFVFIILAMMMLGAGSMLGLLRNFEEVSKSAGGAQSKSDEISFAVVLYLFMVGGMLSHHLHMRFSVVRAHRKEFDLGLFLAPIFASPIVFVPLLGALQNADPNFGEERFPKLMIFLVAFENGFFWKEYFDNRRAERSGQ